VFGGPGVLWAGAAARPTTFDPAGRDDVIVLTFERKKP
jgi:hypothetical protein